MGMGILLQARSGLNLNYFKFEETSNPIYAGVFGAIVLVALLFFLYYYLTRRARFREQSTAREETRLRLLLTEFNLTDHDQQTLEQVTGSDVAAEIIPLVTLRTTFEQAVEAFREANPDHPAIKRIPQLRQRLGYGFGNLRNPFSNTRMLQPGIRLQCTVPHPKRPVQFVTTIVAISERGFFVRPPTSKGKPVNLTRFPDLTFKVTREQDAEYEFTSKILGQTQTGMNAVAMEHTHSIRKLLFRHAPRIPVSLEVHFFVIKQEIAAERRHRTFKRHESQYSIIGEILDLSLGGLRLIAELPGQRPVEGDIVAFQLPQANIKDDLVAEIIDVSTPKPNSIQLHMQLIGTKEINRLKLSKYLQDLQAAGAVPLQQPPLPPEAPKEEGATSAQ